MTTGLYDDTIRLRMPRMPGGPATDRTSPLPASVDEALAEVPSWPLDLRPGEGRTARLWEVLANLAANDLAVARAVEPHLDARAILAQAGLERVLGRPVSEGTWGVYAAEGPGMGVSATPSGTEGGWVLSGTKPWCSLAGRLDAALMTATVGDGSRRLFAVDLHDGGIQLGDEPWVSRGLAEIPSVSITVHGVAGEPVGEAGWYLERPGFVWGAIGVAACWYGGAVGLARTVYAAAHERGDQDIAMMHLGWVDEQLHAARQSLILAAEEVDTGGSLESGIQAKRVRAVVARACEDVLRSSAHLLGPGPLVLDERHAKRVADLQIYLRQHHGERDLASLGRELVARSGLPW